ncbi:MAG: TAXI family TRAP transporter solute-binding subunit [Hyphomicrobiales bacterium]
MLNKIQKALITAAIATVMTGVTASSVLAEDIRIGAMREGSAWYVFAATLEQIIEPILGANTVEVIARGGGVANPMVVQGGKAEIALANKASAVWAYQGTDVYKGLKAPDIRALVGGLNNVYVGVLARNKFLEKMGTNDLKAILTSGKPVRLLMKPVGSSAVPVAQMLLESVGSSFEKIKADGGDIIQVGTGQIADQIRNGNADIYVDTMIKGHPTITEVALTSEVTFLDLPTEAQNAAESHGLDIGKYGPWFKGQETPTIGANLGTVLIANVSLDEETAYKITKAIVENVKTLKASHGAWARFNPQNAWKTEYTGIELHPGAARYYREAGLIE